MLRRRAIDFLDAVKFKFLTLFIWMCLHFDVQQKCAIILLVVEKIQVFNNTVRIFHLMLSQIQLRFCCYIFMVVDFVAVSQCILFCFF